MDDIPGASRDVVTIGQLPNRSVAPEVISGVSGHCGEFSYSQHSPDYKEMVNSYEEGKSTVRSLTQFAAEQALGADSP